MYYYYYVAFEIGLRKPLTGSVINDYEKRRTRVVVLAPSELLKNTKTVPADNFNAGVVYSFEISVARKYRVPYFRFTHNRERSFRADRKSSTIVGDFTKNATEVAPPNETAEGPK